MQEEKLRQLFEEIDPEGNIPDAKKEDFILAVRGINESPLPISTAVKAIEDLKIDLEKQTDWRKKASIAAKIISLGLDA